LKFDCSIGHHRGATLREEFLQETAVPLMEAILIPLLSITLFFHGGTTLRDEFLQETAISLMEGILKVAQTQIAKCLIR